jgi:hypothetical protein
MCLGRVPYVSEVCACEKKMTQPKTEKQKKWIYHRVRLRPDPSTTIFRSKKYRFAGIVTQSKTSGARRFCKTKFQMILFTSSGSVPVNYQHAQTIKARPVTLRILSTMDLSISDKACLTKNIFGASVDVDVGIVPLLAPAPALTAEVSSVDVDVSIVPTRAPVPAHAAEVSSVDVDVDFEVTVPVLVPVPAAPVPAQNYTVLAPAQNNSDGTSFCRMVVVTVALYAVTFLWAYSIYRNRFFWE